MIQTMTAISGQRTAAAPKTMPTNTILLLAAIISVASAFNSVAPISIQPLSDPGPFSRSPSTGAYGSRVQSLSSPSSLSRVRTKQQTLKLTRLQFSDDASSNSAIESSWWRKLFSVSSPSPNRSSTVARSSDGSGRSESDEQESVDTYLEFLDKRYRRLHSDDSKEGTEGKESSDKKDSSAIKIGKPFSAMDWLTNGGINNSNAVGGTRKQQEDALYVLGVAGLASQKLLQKHHLPSTINPSDRSTAVSSETNADEAKARKAAESKKRFLDAIEVNDDVNMNELNRFIVNKFLLPIVRMIYFAQRRKQLLLKMIQEQAAVVVTKATDGLSDAFSQGPKSILNTVLGIGGGRQNILRTLAIGYATIIVFRPLLQALLAEGLAFDPLIQ